MPAQELEKHRSFIKFFERDTRANIYWLAKQIKSAIQNSDQQPILGARTIKRYVITPLVMDFDTCIEPFDASSEPIDLSAEYKSCEHQFKRLKQAIIDTQDCGIEIYPFMGFALNKLNQPDALTNLQAWWEENGYSAADRLSCRGAKLPPGKAIGIKIYPPLGFNPWPENPPQAYLRF